MESCVFVSITKTLTHKPKKINSIAFHWSNAWFFASHEMYWFEYGYNGYNQIKMVE